MEITDQMVAAFDLISRTGAMQLEANYDRHVERSNWWAAAYYRGARVTVEGHPSPEAAIDALLTRLLDGATCRWCAREVTNRTDTGGDLCRFRLVGPEYVRGCISTHHEKTVPLPTFTRGGVLDD